MASGDSVWVIFFTGQTGKTLFLGAYSTLDRAKIAARNIVRGSLRMWTCVEGSQDTQWTTPLRETLTIKGAPLDAPVNLSAVA